MAYDYGAKEPEKLKIKDMTPKQKELLIDSKTFCMMPWLHLHAFPDGRAYPCCFALDQYPVGDLNKDSMETVFNSNDMKKMRLNMLDDRPSRQCTKCYDQEKSGFFSLRLSSNKHFGHNIGMVDNTNGDGSADFVIKYWDIRFSNLCNLACRSCGTWFSSNWYEDHKKLTGNPPNHAKIMRVGRTANDIWEQMLKQFDHVEQFYFAGGEPLIMEEHYRILKRLVEKKMFHVRLKYNTNFSQVIYKGMDVFKEWDKFEYVEIGASLDATHKRGEYLRSGQSWEQVEENRKHVFEKCPRAFFFIATCVDVFNCFHVSDFHIDWIKKEWVGPHSLLNPLQTPEHLRVQILPKEMKDKLAEKWTNAQTWMKENTNANHRRYESMISYLYESDYTHMLNDWYDITNRLDKIRNENWREVFPELLDLEKIIKS